MVRYYGYYSDKSRDMRRQTDKEVALRSTELPIDHPATAWQYQWHAISARMWDSEDVEESRRAWLEKRKRNFKNR